MGLEQARIGRKKTYLSVSCSANTCRLVWSRMTLMFIKHPRSSFLARNIDILRTVGVELEAITEIEVAEEHNSGEL